MQNNQENQQEKPKPEEQKQQHQQQQVKKEIKISTATKDRADAARLYIERKYAKMLQKEIENKEYWIQLNQKLQNMQFTPQEQIIIKHNIAQKECENLRKLRVKKSTKDYESLNIIGRGAFGEVRLCQDRQTQEIVAIKRMNNKT
ncbi:protein kinase domain protein [Ichthyophthirius multifiliis]|uniref:Protein kinase domain protein n=1 Tax=Ichthyophthirius multifiliis TaxID=5932 RepID=G0QP51_ICHMU|nr:protein kinase domain protein [Ichthyophthirius multifiliis]EGR33004.1 protein kinase domain protein [Ichthyophthirius multifiliis]|eukprot:XP_004036990.1 protein kinase domain protein [Ichthyophthirius multifiliis]